MQTYLWINEEALSADSPSVEAYESERHLVAELHADVAARRRCFVTSNSKLKVEKLAAALSDVVECTRQLLLVTSDTITTEEVQEFIENPAEKIRDYDAILTSPSLGHIAPDIRAAG
jgi:hypothetical protein